MHQGLRYQKPCIVLAEDGGPALKPASRAPLAEPPPTTHRLRFRLLCSLAVLANPQQHKIVQLAVLALRASSCVHAAQRPNSVSIVPKGASPEGQVRH